MRHGKRPTRNTGPWSSHRVLNASSPIITADIHSFLVTAVSSWTAEADSYTETEKRSIIDSLPPRYRTYELDAEGRLKCPLSVEFVLDDPYIKAAVHKFKRDVSEGCYEKTWQNQARKAMQERRDGKFDPYLQEQTEQTFGDPSSSDGQDETAADKNIEPEVDSSDGDWAERNSGSARGSKKNKGVPQT
ncbi:uncharacterized protein Z520_04773 [Fonsecaea multimorphosa CBS 102226]|uniref:ASX DEUBAD domain-containing protein n=1 Tax=Fonsecaea multimorphosa CBS 102226 TaxID=1442371 RepID=A0A0D2K061_9EURO|nr:uncharacterized protein Z520_04773 [Fonsecaea multimorphosa CBS 102226]KIX99197.1 hypothetical protein Z520_04773 [Fonsecaea multimorphosa CBS 102226]OAL25894.1 hypothetical protein AYO22_04521 [Fonsecaea multimorphosa]